MAFARPVRASASACGSPCSTRCRTGAGPTAPASPRSRQAPATRTRSVCWTTTTWRRRSPTLARCCRALRAMDIRFVCITAGSPYYCPHVQRPALFPPSDGYDPPEDPLTRRRAPDRRGRAPQGRVPRHDVRRHRLQLPAGMAAARGRARRHAMGASTSSVSAAWCCRIRSFPPMCWRAARSSAASICRTFSDCTTGPRNRLVSGCYPARPVLHEAFSACTAEGS